jgi:hypothetical protein
LLKKLFLLKSKSIKHAKMSANTTVKIDCGQNDC